MNVNKVKKGAILIAILILPTVAFFILHSGTNNFKKLPFYGPKKVVEGSLDTIYHSIPNFQFTNHLGELINQDDYRGKIYVADFFFTICPTICPKMSTHMLELQKHFYDRADFKLLSHTVDPENDSVEVLYEYSKRVYAQDSVWNFVTGSKEDIYRVAFEGYFANAMEDELAPGGFLHSSNLFLIDREGRIRGIFDGTSTREVESLMDAIQILLREEYVSMKNKK